MKSLSDNGRAAIGYICLALVVMSYFIWLAWILSPTDWTFNINLSADDNILEIVETAEEMQREGNFEDSNDWSIGIDPKNRLFQVINHTEDESEIWLSLGGPGEYLIINPIAYERVRCEDQTQICYEMRDEYKLVVNEVLDAPGGKE